MAQGSGFSSRRPIEVPLTGRIGSPEIRSGAGSLAATANIFGGLSRGLNLLGNQLLDQEERQEQEEETRAGEAAGIESARAGEAFALRDSGVFGRRADVAYNRAAEIGYAQGLEVEVEERRQQLEMAHEADPDSFMKSWDQYQSDVIRRTPESLRPKMGLMLGQHGNRADFRLADQKQARVEAQAAFNVRLRADQLITLSANAAHAQGDPTAAAEHLGDLQTSIGEAVAAGWLEPATAASILLNGRDQVIEAGYTGAFERSPSFDALQDFVAADTPELSPQRKDVLAGRMQATVSRMETAARKVHADLGRNVDAAIDALRAGIEINPAELNELRQRAAGTEFAPELETAAAIAPQVRSVSQLTPAEIEQRIVAVRAEREALASAGVPIEAADEAAGVVGQLEAFEEVLTTSLDRTRMAIGNGQVVDRAVELGLVEAAPLDFTSNESLADSLDARMDEAETAEIHFDIPAGNVLVESEVDALGQFLKPGAATVDAQIAVLTTMHGRMGQDRMAAVLTKVAEDEPEIAYVAGLPPRRMDEALRGRAVLLQNSQMTPSAGEVAVREVVSNVYGDVLAEAPATVKAATETARWLYAARKAQEGDLTGELDPDAFATALNDAVGGIVEWENSAGLTFLGDDTSRVIAPRPGMTSNQFANLMDSLRDDELAAAGQQPMTMHGEPVGADVVKRLGRLRSIGDGLYTVTVGNFGLVDQNGRAFVLDLGAVLRAREPRR
jgi:hypothetical protein